MQGTLLLGLRERSLVSTQEAADSQILRAIVESSQDAIIGESMNGRILAWNRGAEHLYGYSAAGTIGGTMAFLLPDDWPDEQSEALERIGRGGRLDHFETVRRKQCGSLIDVSLTISPILGGEGQIIGISHVARDITERKRLEERLRQLALIVESSNDAIISKSRDGTILTWNGGAERMYGYTSVEAVGMKMILLSPEDRPNEEREILERVGRGEYAHHFETVRRTKTGSLIDVSLTISPIRDQHGRITGASHVARDVTERKRGDSRLRHTQKLESLGVLAGGIAHDFNNLLTGILSNTSLALEMLSADQPIRELLSDALEASEGAARLTRQLLAYAGKGCLVIEPTNLTKVVRDVTNLIHTSIPTHVQMQLNLSDTLAMISGDSGQLQQLAMNLIINAAEAIGPKAVGTVTVSTCMQTVDSSQIQILGVGMEPVAGEYVCFEVKDTGCGMDPKTLSQIFDPFFTTKFTGRGLGLAAIQGIVRGHNGSIEVRSKPGEGTLFKILLPTTPEAEFSGTIATVLPLAQGELILLIDDEPLIRRTVKIVLEHHGYAVVVAESGLEGISIFRALGDKVAAVVLDMTMPGMNGEETLEQLKLINPAVKIIVCSGYSEFHVIGRFDLGKGPAGFIQKPCSAAQIAAIVGSVVRPADDPLLGLAYRSKWRLWSFRASV